MDYLKKKFGQLVLASESPRRAAILKQVGFDFIIHPSCIDEFYSFTEPVDIAQELAEKKAAAVSVSFPDHIVLGADTIVVLDHHILGKPENDEDAFRILSLLSGRTHQVYTAFCLVRKSRNMILTDYECTDVTFRHLQDDEIRAYIRTGSPMDKAGSYGIQDGSAVFIERISGDFYNVVGLPVTRLYRALFAHFNQQQEE